MVDDKKVEQVEKKILGVYVYSSLTWQDHIQWIEGKIARAFGVICKARHFFYTATLKTLYYSFLYPYLNYCIEVWGNTFPTYITPLNRLQNRAIRIIPRCNKRTHLQPLYTLGNPFAYPGINIKHPFCYVRGKCFAWFPLFMYWRVFAAGSRHRSVRFYVCETTRCASAARFALTCKLKWDLE